MCAGGYTKGRRPTLFRLRARPGESLHPWVFTQVVCEPGTRRWRPHDSERLDPQPPRGSDHSESWGAL